jgi:hypothetical protein
MSGGPSETQIKTLDLFRKKIEYYEYILANHFKFVYQKNNHLFYIRKSKGPENSSDFCPKDSVPGFSPKNSVLPERLSLKSWWNREDILVNKTDMNDYDFSKFVKSSYPDLSDFQLFHVISSEKEVIEYKPFEFAGLSDQRSNDPIVNKLYSDSTRFECTQIVIDEKPCGGGGGGGIRQKL